MTVGNRANRRTGSAGPDGSRTGRFMRALTTGFATTLGDAGRRKGDDSVPGIIDIMYFIAVD
jgi:hypothetical protein